MNNRREFLRQTVGLTVAVGAGFAQAVQPTADIQPIHTNAAGLLAGVVRLKNGSHEFEAYRAQPGGKKNLPIVLVVSEIFGVHEHIADLCRRLAHLGYLAIAPEIFTRWGDAKNQKDIPTLMANVVGKSEDAAILSDLDSCAQWAADNGGDAARLLMTGFCFGGRITWLYAAHNPKLKAGVAWYGRLEGPTSARTPVQPVDVAARLYAPVLGLYGGADTGIPEQSVETMRAALAVGNRLSKASVITVYPGAPHAFNADYRPSYRQAAAEAGWAAMLAWFTRYGA